MEDTLMAHNSAYGLLDIPKSHEQMMTCYLPSAKYWVFELGFYRRTMFCILLSVLVSRVLVGGVAILDKV